MSVVCKILRTVGVTAGTPLWISPRVFFDVGSGGLIEIGDGVVISHYVRVLTHDFSLDAYQRMNSLLPPNRELVRHAKVVIGDFAFIGMGASILPGVVIGKGSIVGSGSVVTRDVPPNTVVAGNPARTICTVSELYQRSSHKFHEQERRR